MSKNDIIVQERSSAVQLAVEMLKRSEYKATAIKVELEAQLNRRNIRGESSCDNNCDDGYYECGECGGSWEGSRCENDCDEGYLRCPMDCADGEIQGEDGLWGTCPEADCDSGYVRCDEYCTEGYYDNCEYCDEGTNRCDECDGEGSTTHWGSTEYCHNWLMSKLAELDLAEQTEDMRALAHGIVTYWHPKGALKYAEFYNDGSVDSEFTFTLSLEQPENVLLLPKFIEIFKAMADEMGTTINTSGAGMHMALLNNPECIYPADTRVVERDRFRNFKKSMTLLLPALYFLGSSNDVSRGLSYRRPGVGSGDHRSAIDWRGGAVEFRIFNTCYDTPEAILDNVVVMSNAMKYWRSKYRKHGLSKVSRHIDFGVDNSDKLDRFYVRVEHIELLNRGLNLLKPSYYTIRQLKEQRKFNKTKTTVKMIPKKLRQEAIVAYREYDNRFDFATELKRLRDLANTLEGAYNALTPEERLTTSRAELEQRVIADIEAGIEREKQRKQPLDAYVEEQVNQGLRQLSGAYTLQVEEE